MKRCPKCNFIYLDADQFCDLDQTALIFTDEAEVDAPTDLRLEESPRAALNAGPDLAEVKAGDSFKPLVLVAVAGMAIGMVLFFAYSTVGNKEFSPNQPQQHSSPQPSADQIVLPEPSPQAAYSPEQLTTAEVESTPSPSVSSSPQTNPGRHKLSSNPVSTSGDVKSGTVTIRLTDGGTLEADQAWRTREGIWFRRHGVVTLLKPGRVQSIEKSKPTEGPLPK